MPDPRLSVSLASALAVVVAANFGIQAWLGAEGQKLTGSAQRAANVVVLRNNAAHQSQDDVQGCEVLLLGNSHTYALPGLNKGDGLRPDPGVTLVDRLAAHTERMGAPSQTWCRLAYPNFLPFEMLVRTAQLLESGARPKRVILGLTWRNVARDTKLRASVQSAFDSESFSQAFAARLERLEAAERIRETAASEFREAAQRREQERTKSSADVIDEQLTAEVGKLVPALGLSRAVRTRVYRTLNVVLTQSLRTPKTKTFDYAVIDEDLAFNLASLHLLFDLLAKNGVHLILYQAPERSDLPPMIDPERQAQEVASLSARAQKLGFTVLDARNVVPNEHWGFIYDAPDRSHFTEPGHDLLAGFLVRTATSAWLLEAGTP